VGGVPLRTPANGTFISDQNAMRADDPSNTIPHQNASMVSRSTVVTDNGVPSAVGLTRQRVPNPDPDPATDARAQERRAVNQSTGRENSLCERAGSNPAVPGVEADFVMADLARALERQEFVLHYQPKVNLETGKIAGAEALLRWVHPVMGMLPAERFLPIARDFGLMVPIALWMLREACAQARRWKDAAIPFGSMAVEISDVQLRAPDFARDVEKTLLETGLSAHCLQLEIAESTLKQDAGTDIPVLHRLGRMGVQLAVANYGTGDFSLGFLIRFPIDALKIDSAFVDHIATPASDSALVSGLVVMGHKLQVPVVAQGVTDQAQLSFLEQQHCEQGQGVYFSAPVEAGKFAALMKIANAHADCDCGRPCIQGIVVNSTNLNRGSLLRDLQRPELPWNLFGYESGPAIAMTTALGRLPKNGICVRCCTENPGVAVTRIARRALVRRVAAATCGDKAD
jgi:EAL domain-containing protein (putative c-di-GMP-specific phosphodiesterase class I)